MNLTRHIRQILDTAAMRICLACAAVFLFCGQVQATNMMYAFTNQLGQGDTNELKEWQVSGPTANADGSFTTIGLPMRIRPAADGQATNFIMQGNWFVTNAFLGKGIYFGNFPQDSGPTVYRMWDYQISGANLFITRIVGNSNAITANAVTQAMGFPLISSVVATNSFDPTNAAFNATNVLGSAAYKSAGTFDPTNSAFNATNAMGSAAYKPVGYFQPAAVNLSNYSGMPTNVYVPTNALPGLTNGFIQGLTATNSFDPTNSAFNATNALGSAAYKSIGNFQPATLNLSNYSGMATNVFLASKDGNGTNTLIVSGKTLSTTNLAILGDSSAPGRISFPHGDIIAETVNDVTSFSTDSGICVGISNGVPLYEKFSFLAGAFNDIAAGNGFPITGSTIGGGVKNIVGFGGGGNGDYSTVAGGLSNTVRGVGGTVSGGVKNQTFNADYSVVSGGFSNVITSPTGFDITGGVIPGGASNSVTANYSFAAGFGALASNVNTFVWNDFSAGGFASGTNNQFIIHASNGVGINTNQAGTNGLRVSGNVDAAGFSVGGIPISSTAVAAGSGVTVATNGNIYTVAADKQTNLVVFQAANWTNGTAQQSFSLGGGPTFSMSTNVIGISNSIAKGTYQLIAPGVWTNLNQTGYSLNLSAGIVFAESNLAQIFALNGSTFNSTNWSIVAAPGALPTPVSYVGWAMQGDGGVINGYFPWSSNLFNIITNQAAIAAARVSPFPTNGFNSLTITNTRSAGFIVTNPASATAMVVLTNGDMLANNVVSGANRVILNSTDLATHGIELFINSGASGQYLYMNENGLDVSSTNEPGSFMQFHPNFFLTQVKPLDGKTSVFQVNESDEISGINGVGAGFNVLSTGDVTLFSSNVNFLTISPDGNNYFSGATNIMTGTLTATNDGDLFGSSLYVGRNTAQQVMVIQPAPGAVTNYWQVNGTNAAAVAYVDTNNVFHGNGIQPTNVNLTGWGKYSTNSFVNSTNGASTNNIIYNGTGWTFLNAQAGIVQWKTQLVGAVSEVDVVGGNLQDGQGVITLGWLARTFRDNLGGLVATWTNGFKIISGDIGGATNLAYNGLDLPARQGITNLVNSVFNTSLTPANVNTNLLIAGVSQEGMWTNAIVLRGSSNSINLVYTKQPDLTWSNAGSGFGIFSNTVSGILRVNNIDNGGNILFFKTNSPQGLWSVNFVATNPPTGDWGRISDFGAGGISEGWVITNLPVSAIAGAPPTSPVILSSNRFVFQSRPYTNGYLISPTLTNATIVNGVVAPTNILVPTNYFFQNALSLVLGCSNSIFSKNLSAANYIHPGNDLVFSGQGQFKIIGVLNATQALAVNYISGNANSFTQQPTAYYPSFDFLDINSAGSGGIGNGGEYMGEGNFGTAETGVNSGQASTMWALCGTNSVFWGIAADKSYNLYRVLANSQTPDVIHVDVQNENNYEDIRIRANGDVGMRGLTNTPGSGLGYLPVRGMFYSASNAAPITTFPAAIALGTGFSNTNTTRAQWHGQFILTDAVGGQPILVVSNFTANWVMTNSFPQGLGASAPLSIVTPIVSPSDSLGIYDNSTGSGASVTFVKGWWERQ